MKKNQKIEKKPNSILEICGTITISLIFAITFNIFTNDSIYYEPCSTLSSSYQWGYITAIFYIIACVLGGAIIPLLGYLTERCIENQSSIAMVSIIFLNLIKMGTGVMALVCFGGLCHAYGENEECGQLNDLILAYIIIVSIGLGMGFCVCCILGCCTVCFGKSLLSGMKKELEKSEKNFELVQNGGQTTNVEKEVGIPLEDENMQKINI